MAGRMRLFGLVVFLSITLADMADAYNDHTCTSSQPLFPRGSPVHLYLVGSGRPPIHFDRYLATGTTANLTDGNQNQLAEDIAELEIPPNDRKHSDTRQGVFSCTSSANGSPVSVLLINHHKNSKILPKGFVTKTVSVGETVTLSLDTKSSRIKWRKRGSRVSQWNGVTSFTLSSVTTEDEGVYEAYTCTRGSRAYMRLIVQSCPRNSYGFNCEAVCTCYNGGICNDDGQCICPPGFTGRSCEVVNGPNCFGAQCQYSCDDEVFNLNKFQGTCGGNLFCLPDPYGCSCPPGYRGIGCDEECAVGTFGADCQQTCHCANGSTCDNKMGLCTPLNCEDGWTGDNCNQQVSCRHGPCQNDGICRDVIGSQGYTCLCKPGYDGDRCEKVLAEGDVRLLGGSRAREGLVEVFHNKAWGTICGNLWDNNDASVICRQLGFGDVGSGLVSTAFGQGAGDIWLDHVDCSGSESNISECGSLGWGVHDCAHGEEAGVIC